MKEKIKKLLQEAKTKEALELLVAMAPEAGTLLANFNEASKRNRLGILNYSEFSQKLSEVTYGALELLDNLKEPSAPVGNSTVNNTPAVAIKKVFISYSKEDKTYLETAKKHLKMLERQQKISVWDDTKLLPGELWDTAIRRELASANIILFLVSPDLLATDYIWDIEMQEAITRAEAGKVIVIPIIIRPSTWTSAPFGKFAALPSKGIPISTGGNPDEAWSTIVTQIDRLCN